MLTNIYSLDFEFPSGPGGLSSPRLAAFIDYVLPRLEIMSEDPDPEIYNFHQLATRPCQQPDTPASMLPLRMLPPGMMPPGMLPPGMMPPGMMPPGMGGDPSGQPAVEQMIPREVCRRAAWRLVVLADSILTDDSKRGIAVLGGEAAPAAVELAQNLRRAAMELDATPEEMTLRQALTGLKPPAPAAANAEEAPAAAAK